MPKDEIDLSAVTQAVLEVKTGFEELKRKSAEADQEMLRKGDVDVLLTEQLSKINKSLDEKQALIDKLYAQNRPKSIQIDGKDATVDELEFKAAQFAAVAAKRRGVPAFEHSAQDQSEYKRAYESFLRKKEHMLAPEETKALSVGTDPDGGYLVDADTSGRIVSKVFETSEVRQYAATQVISTDSLEGMYDLEEATFGWVGETESRPETDTPQLGAWSIPVHEMYAEPRATQKILDDSAIDIQGWLARKVAEKFTRAENTAFVNGDGVRKPRGFSTYTAGTTIPGQVEEFLTGVDGNFAATPSGADILIEMIHGLKAPYRRNAVFAMNRTTLGGVRLLKDNDGRMMWQPSLAAGMPSSLLGYPVASFEDLPSYTTTDANAIWLADWSEFYQIVDRMGMRVIRDEYTAKPYVKYYTTRRVGGAVLNFEAGKVLRFGAS